LTVGFDQRSGVALADCGEPPLHGASNQDGSDDHGHDAPCGKSTNVNCA
jgi:hypothetical protein